MFRFSPKLILSAVDFSPVSEAVLRWSGQFAWAFDARVQVFHADWMEPPPYFTRSQVDDLARQMKTHRQTLVGQLTELADRYLGGDLSWEVSIEEGHAVEALRRQCVDARPDLVVVGSHGRSGVSRVLMGSVAENAVRDVGRPVLVARSKSGQATLEKPARLLCAVDFSAASKQALRVALAVTTAFNAELTVLHVAEKAETDIAGIHRRLVDWIHPELGGQMEVTGEIRKGEAAETIVRLASEIGAYLLVVGASPRPFFESRTLGTTAVRVIRHSRVPVLTVPETES